MILAEVTLQFVCSFTSFYSTDVITLEFLIQLCSADVMSEPVSGAAPPRTPPCGAADSGRVHWVYIRTVRTGSPTSKCISFLSLETSTNNVIAEYARLNYFRRLLALKTPCAACQTQRTVQLTLSTFVQSGPVSSAQCVMRSALP